MHETLDNDPPFLIWWLHGKNN